MIDTLRTGSAPGVSIPTNAWPASVDRIDATRPACTWDTKYGLKGTLTRGWPAGENNRTEAR